MSERKYADGYRAKRAADTARLLAVRVLLDVEENGSFANLVLPKFLREQKQANRRFDSRDAAFVSEMVYGTLRQQGYLDEVLRKFVSRPLNQLDPDVLVLMRVGAYQLLFMRVPDHAAVAETVDVARTLTTEGPVKMINAVLRSITRAEPGEIEEHFEKIADRLDRLAARQSHPRWVVEEFQRSLTERGIDGAELEEALAANNMSPQVTLVARPGKITPAELSQEIEEVLQADSYQGQVSEFAVILSGGEPAALQSIREGKAGAQDEGSQLAALVLAEAPLEGPDQQWLDLCAGPGGKTALLAAIAHSRQGHITANEISTHRARLVKRSVHAFENVDVFCEDGRSFGVVDSFDRVLIDAPCTGLGSLRRRPESRWRKQLTDVAELVSLQRDLLRRGIELTRPGGVVAWVTCSPQVDETLGQVEWALANHPVTLIDGASLAQELAVIDLQLGVIDEGRRANLANAEIVENSIQLWPHRQGTDAMFIALMRKRLA